MQKEAWNYKGPLASTAKKGPTIIRGPLVQGRYLYQKSLLTELIIYYLMRTNDAFFRAIKV